MPFVGTDGHRPPVLSLVEEPAGQFRLREPIRFVDGRIGSVFTVPRDLDAFVTDLVTVPDLPGVFTRPLTPELMARVLHDALTSAGEGDLDYLGPPIAREESDRIYRDALGDVGVPTIRRWLRWALARFFTAYVAGGLRRLRLLGAFVLQTVVLSLIVPAVAADATFRWLIAYVATTLVLGLITGRDIGPHLLVWTVGLVALPAVFVAAVAAASYALVERTVGFVARRPDDGSPAPSPLLDLELIAAADGGAATGSAVESTATHTSEPLHVFVSYSQRDHGLVRPWVERLEADLDASVWWDPQIVPGTAWRDSVDAALDSAWCVVVFWTRNSIQSQWVQQEAGDGLRRDILVPVLLEDVQPPDYFSVVQAAQMHRTERSADWDLVIERIGQLDPGAPSGQATGTA